MYPAWPASGRRRLFMMENSLLLVDQPEGRIDITLLDETKHFTSHLHSKPRKHRTETPKIGQMDSGIKPITVCSTFGGRNNAPGFVMAECARTNLKFPGNLDGLVVIHVSHLPSWHPLVCLIMLTISKASIRDKHSQRTFKKHDKVALNLVQLSDTLRLKSSHLHECCIFVV